MSILIVYDNEEAQEWANVFRKEIPEAKVEVYPDVADVNAVDFIVCWKPQDGVFAQFPQLKVAQSLGAGVEHIFDTQNLGADVQVTRIVDPMLSSDMWEYLLAVTLNHLKQLSLYRDQAKEGLWKPHRYKTIAETTVSILGLGQIGCFVAKAFAQLGFVVQGWSRTPKDIEGVRCSHGKDNLPTLLGQTDVLLNILPLTGQTLGILCRENLQHLKSNAYLINVGRGGHLVEKDLLELLDEGRIAGATLDVLSEEPLPSSHPFWRHPKIDVTPHIASLTNIKTATQQIVDNYRNFKTGQPLLNLVSKERGY